MFLEGPGLALITVLRNDRSVFSLAKRALIVPRSLHLELVHPLGARPAHAPVRLELGQRARTRALAQIRSSPAIWREQRDIR